MAFGVQKTDIRDIDISDQLDRKDIHIDSNLLQEERARVDYRQSNDLCGAGKEPVWAPPDLLTEQNNEGSGSQDAIWLPGLAFLLLLSHCLMKVS